MREIGATLKFGVDVPEKDLAYVQEAVRNLVRTSALGRFISDIELAEVTP